MTEKILQSQWTSEVEIRPEQAREFWIFVGRLMCFAMQYMEHLQQDLFRCSASEGCKFIIMKREVAQFLMQ